MFEITLGAWIVAIIIVAASKNKIGTIILCVVTLVLVLMLAKSCSDDATEEQQRIERQDEISRQIRETKEKYKRYDGPGLYPVHRSPSSTPYSNGE